METKRKTIMVLCIAVTMVVAACNHSTNSDAFKYKISGKTDYLSDNSKVILAHGIEIGKAPKKEDVITTMTVKNGSFECEGDATQTEACMLYLPSDGAFMPVFIEKGEIGVFFAKNPNDTYVSGTPFNDSIRMLAQKNIKCARDFQHNIKDFHNPPTEEEKEIINSLNSKMRRDIGDIHYECALRNIDNELGFFLTINSANLFSYKQLKTLVNKLPKSKLNHPIIEEFETPIEEAIPEFVLQDEHGYSYNVRSLVKMNKITIIDFWASWCGPCMEEMPKLLSLYNKYSYKGLGIIGISLDKNKKDWINSYKDKYANWIQLWDKDGEVAEMFQINTIPHTIVVNQKGEVIGSHLRSKQLNELLYKILK